METKEYYQALIDVIEYALSNSISVIKNEEGQRLAGGYWPRISNYLKETRAGIELSGDNFQVTQRQLLPTILTDCRQNILQLIQSEEDRKLDNAAKSASIQYSRRAFWISIGALVVAGGSLLWQIIHAIA